MECDDVVSCDHLHRGLVLHLDGYTVARKQRRWVIAGVAGGVIKSSYESKGTNYSFSSKQINPNMMRTLLSSWRGMKLVGG